MTVSRSPGHHPIEHDADLTVVLDLDGTLVDSVYLHATAWREAFWEVGLDVPTFRVHRAVGMGGDKLVSAVAGETAEQAIGEDVRRLHGEIFEKRIHHVRPLDGAPELLRACRDAGLRMVLASSSPPELTDRLLGIVEGSHLIEQVVSGDEAPSKPAPGLIEAALARVGSERAFVVGDSVWDVEAARQAGHPCVGLESGGYSAAELLQAGAVSVHQTPRHLADALASDLAALSGT